ncbi:MAG: ATP-binding protein [Bacillota bacterium]
MADEALSPEETRDVLSFEETPAVIVMDDEESIRLGCEKVLNREGFEVTVAPDGETGWDLLRDGDFDLALIDLKMPGIDGMGILSLINENLPDVVPIVITGYASYETAVETVKLGAYDYIPKPFTPDELRNVVRRGLERRFLRLANRRLREERRRFLLDLTEERSRLMTILRAMSDGVLVVNRRGELVLTNPVGRRLLTDDFDASSEKPPSLGRVLKYPDIADLVARVESDPELEGCDAEVDTSDDRVFHSTATAVRDDDGTYLGAVIVSRDVTERREIEKMKSAFVRMVSHELKSPLAAVQGYLELLIDGDVSEEDRDHMLRRCRTRLEALQEMIGDLLDLSRIESGASGRELRKQGVGEVLEDIVELQRDLAAAREIDIQLEVGGRPEIVADRRELEEIFTNLVSNAVKYNRDGGSVSVEVEDSGDRLVATVSDTGIGMDSGSLDHVFDEFYRVRSAQTAKIAGTGLGLAIVKRLVEAYDGDIGVESSPGEGTTFRVELPKNPT